MAEEACGTKQDEQLLTVEGSQADEHKGKKRSPKESRIIPAEMGFLRIGLTDKVGVVTQLVLARVP